MMDKLTDRAAGIGREHGKNAASWVFDGNTSEDTYRRVLQGIEDGDPMILDSLREPSLSGEFADDYSETDLAQELGIEAYSDDSDAAATAWADAASEAFWHSIAETCRKHVPRATSTGAGTASPT